MLTWSCAALVLLAGCRSCGQAPLDTADTAPASSSDPRNVVVLILDGLRMEESFGDGHSDAADMNTVDILPQIRSELLPQGALIKPAYSTGITITAPGHSDMITGARQAFGNYPNDEGEGAYLPELPTLFEELRAQHGVSKEQVIMSGNTLLAIPLYRSLYPGYTDLSADTVYFYDETAPLTDPRTLIAFREELQTRQPRLAFVNLHGIDRAGHNEAVEHYGDQAQDLDSALVSFWNWLRDVDGYGPNTILVLTADHGRHRDPDIEEVWRDHGDQCSGCRELPLFLVGPGIQADTIIETPHTLPDLTATLAWLLETDLPHGEGIVIADALTEPPTERIDRAGVVYPAATSDALAVQRWRDDIPRSVIEVNDVVVSGEDIFAAERPRVLTTALGTVACWRELTLEPGAEEMPWHGVCAINDGTGWAEMAMPGLPVFPLWAPSIQEDADGGLWMAMIANSGGAVGSAKLSYANIWVLGYDPDTATWDVSEAHSNGTGLIFPTDARLVVTDDSFFIAYGTSADRAIGRKTRRIEVYRQSRGPGGLWESVIRIGPGSDTETVLDLTIDSDRLEHPALARGTDGVFRLGFLSYTEAGVITVIAMDAADGLSWSAPETMDTSGRILPHIDPIWTAAGVLLWAQLGEADTVEVCARAIGGVLACADTGAAYIMGLTEDDGVVTVSTRQDAAADWTLGAVSL
ncbi:MAG: hypothetical protein ACI8RZ_005881 [Myxococcota bacterium]|jgi:hypothetical protein